MFFNLVKYLKPVFRIRNILFRIKHAQHKIKTNQFFLKNKTFGPYTGMKYTLPLILYSFSVEQHIKIQDI